MELDLMSLARWGAMRWERGVTTLEQFITPVLRDLPGLRQLTIKDESVYGLVVTLPRGSCAELKDVELRVVDGGHRR